MTPADSISAMRSSWGQRGSTRWLPYSSRIGCVDGVLQEVTKPNPIGDFAKISWCVMRRSLKFEARVGDKLSSWSVVRNRTRRCSGMSESAASSGPESGTSGGADVGRNEGSSKQGVRGATAGCRESRSHTSLRLKLTVMYAYMGCCVVKKKSKKPRRQVAKNAKYLKIKT